MLFRAWPLCQCFRFSLGPDPVLCDEHTITQVLKPKFFFLYFYWLRQNFSGLSGYTWQPENLYALVLASLYGEMSQLLEGALV